MPRMVATAPSRPASGHGATPQPWEAKRGLSPLHVACKVNLSGNPLPAAAHPGEKENLRVCPSVGWPGGSQPLSRGAIPRYQRSLPAQLPVP